MLFINETKRSELPDSEFGIPEDRKFPLDTKEHVQSAIKLFGHAEESKKKLLAKKIASKAKQYDIEIPENTQVYKYLNKSYVIEGLFGQQVGDIHKLEDPKYAKELSKKIRETPAKEYEDRKNKIGLLTLLQTISIVGVVTAPLALIFSACISAAKRSCTKEDELNKMVYLIDLCIKNTEAQISSRAVPESEKEKLRKAVKNLEDNKKYFTSKKEVTKKYKDYKNQLIVINDSPFVGAFSLTGVILDGYECKPEYIKEIESTNDLPVEGYIEGLAVMNKQEILKLLDKNKYENNENGYEKVPRGKTISDLYYNNGDAIVYCYDDNKCYCFNDKYADEPLVKVSLDKVLNAANKAYSDLKKIIKDEDISSLNESYGYKSDFTYYDEGVFEESSKNNYKKIYDIAMKMFKDSGRLPNAEDADVKQFLATGKTNDFGGALCIAGLGTGFEGTCSKINKEIKPLGGKISADNYGTAMLSIKESNDDLLELPSDVEDTDKSITELLDSTNPKKVYLTSDWHIFQTHYKKEHNYVNTSEIISWCKKNIKDDDIFMYLGDMSYRWVNDEDKAKVKEIFKSLPGIKILVIGNHDEFSDGGNYEEYGFKYAVKEIHYKNIIFTHKPIDMHDKPDMLNIHGHMHKWAEYNTTDGSANVNVYPAYYNNKPITLDRIINHKDYYMRNNKRSDWSGMGESTNLIEECIDMIENQLNKENNVNEWAMASFNPVIGIQKPYVLKAVDDTGSCINSKLYALSPDVISDKYLVVDESSKLSIVDKSYFDNYNLEVYEYTGNELNVGKIKEAYDNGDIVSPNYIYETLSGKDLLSIDQIDFNENFSKVDLDSINAETESIIHTIQADWDKINGALFYVPNINNEVSLRFNDALDVLEDLNGFYLENRLTHKRTKSVPDIENITEAMYNSVI